MTLTVIVLDSVGVGALPDADVFNDAGAHTLDHTLARTGVTLPNLAALGLGCVPGVHSVPAVARPGGAYGRMRERSPGKDTTTGHWEFMGVVLDQPFRTFQRFPDAVMEAFDAATGRPHLGNRPASGTEIIEELGPEHARTGAPIVYTSADSVFQVAAHVDVVPLDTLYAWCEAARELLRGPNAVARVIARPFRGEPGAYERLNGARHDYSLTPPRTVLNALAGAGREVVAIGKIADIFAGSGITRTVSTPDNDAGVDATLEAMRARPDGLVFTNLVDFDARYGHRRDPDGYAAALAAFDARLPELLAARAAGDALILTSDHGNDPTWAGTDHTREYGLLLADADGAAGRDLGTRASFADLGATIAEACAVRWDGPGASFAAALRAHA
ncbi:MAG: phosphopentomutase [Trueperaceae bacterium]|nr:phosphopentomutase [Trueperaceae bacterium]